MVGHGIPYEKQRQAMDDLMLGRDNWKSAAKFLGVRYIYWGADEERTWPAKRETVDFFSRVGGNGGLGRDLRLP